MASAHMWRYSKWSSHVVPVVDAAMEDLDELHLRRHFRRRFPDWTAPDDWRETLIAHKLAVEVESRVLPMVCLRGHSAVRGATGAVSPRRIR